MYIIISLAATVKAQICRRPLSNAEKLNNALGRNPEVEVLNGVPFGPDVQLASIPSKF